MENYLLEKARLVDQGGGERNYHIFYFLIKGATKEEQALFHFKDMTKYDMLYHGHTIIIDNETDKDTGVNTYVYTYFSPYLFLSLDSLDTPKGTMPIA